MKNPKTVRITLIEYAGTGEQYDPIVIDLGLAEILCMGRSGDQEYILDPQEVKEYILDPSKQKSIGHNVSIQEFLDHLCSFLYREKTSEIEVEIL